MCVFQAWINDRLCFEIYIMISSNFEDKVNKAEEIRNNVVNMITYGLQAFQPIDTSTLYFKWRHFNPSTLYQNIAWQHVRPGDHIIVSYVNARVSNQAVRGEPKPTAPVRTLGNLYMYCINYRAKHLKDLFS